MKLKKFEFAAIFVLIVAVFFTGGYFLGRGSVSGDVVIEPQSGVTTPADYFEEAGADNETATEPVMLSPGETVNINTADKTQLEALPGIGSVLAQRIVEYREANGSFAVTEDIMEVEGIGSGKYDDIKNLIKVK